MSRIFDSILESDLDTDSYDVPVYEGYDAETGGIRACAECFEDMVDVYESIHTYASLDLAMEADEAKAEEKGEEVDEEKKEENEEKKDEAKKNIFKRMIEAIKKLWGKITNFFKNAYNSFKANRGNIEKFVKKYKEDFLKIEGNLQDFKFKGYQYNAIGLVSDRQGDSFTKVDEAIKKIVTGNESMEDLQSIETEKEKHVGELRKVLLGYECEAKDFRKKIAEYYRGGTEKIDIQYSSTELFTNGLEAQKSTEKEIKEAKKSMDKSFKDMINKLKEESKKKASSDEEKASIKRAQIKQSLFVSGKQLAIQKFNTWQSIQKEQISEYRSYIVSAIAYASKNSKKDK